MFCQKRMFMLLAVMCLGLSNDSGAMAGITGAIVRTAAAQCVGHSVGAGVGVAAASGVIVAANLPNYQNVPTPLLQVQQTVLKNRLQPQALVQEFSETVQQNPVEALKTLAPTAVSLGIALCSRGKIQPVAIGALFGAANYTTLAQCNKSLLDYGTLRNMIVTVPQEVIALGVINVELTQREQK